MPWTIVRSNRFKKRYQEKTPKQQAQVDEAIKLLVQCNDPRTLGRPKQGKIKGCYGHDLDFHNRILYAVDQVKHEINFLRVCSHDEVYGS
jgi:mRNA-degrading endonuclease YafQ of YafQ-DinJ toxin-antitoxin module